MVRFVTAGFLFLVFELAAAPVVEACAVCVAGAAGEDRVADAFNWSVLFLMGMPYAVLGSVAGFIFYAHRRAAKRRNPGKPKARVYHLAWNHKESGR